MVAPFGDLDPAGLCVLRHRDGQGGRESDLIYEAYYEAFGIDLGQES